jgi:hypothetical protein
MAIGDFPRQRAFGETTRPDNWWVQPLVVFSVLTSFIIYTTWAAFQGRNYFYDGGGAEYLSPFYSPLLFGQPGEPRWFAATHPSWWPSILPFSPAFLILIGPAGMRFTCYYYRGAYYKAFWADPPACSVGEPRKSYLGEAKLPLIFQNLHRFFFYPAAAFVLILTYDAWRAMWFVGADGGHHFGIGVGTIVMVLNAFLLGCYTFGCHCMRHMIGGYLDCLSKSPARKCGYTCISALNRRHMMWAWISLVWVAFTDVYVRLCAAGIWTDWRIF